MRAADFHRLAGDGERATALLEQLLLEVPPGVERADVLVALVLTFRGDPAAIIERCEEALGEAGADDARASRILALRTGVHLWNADVGASLIDSRAALEKAERVDDPALLALAIARVGTAESLAAVTTPGLLERGAEIEERYGLALQYFESPLYLRSRLLLRLGEIDRPRAILEELEAKAAARGDEGSRVMILWTLGLLEWFAGSWQRALEYATAAHDLTEQTQHSHGHVWVGRVKALVEADLGLVDQARASAEESVVFSQETSNEYGAIISPGLFGRLELMLGNLEAAAGYLRSLPGGCSLQG